MNKENNFNMSNLSRILYIGDLKYMDDIIESDLSDEEKATTLYNYSNFSNILGNLDIYNDSGLEENDLLKKIKRFYTKYESLGLLPLSKNSYRCCTVELEERIFKMKLIIDIINSKECMYDKAEKLYLLYPKAKEFKRNYTLMNNFGSKDERFDCIREGFDRFQEISDLYTRLELDGTFDNIKHYLNTKEYLENYDYAKFVIEEYINLDDSYKFKEFCDTLGIDEDMFKFFSDTIKELNADLYNSYIEKNELNKKLDIKEKSNTIRKIAKSIRNGNCDLIEFLKDVPFKEDSKFVGKISTFMKTYAEEDAQLVINFMHKNNLYYTNALRPLPLDQIYNSKTTIGGVELTSKDKDIIVNYLNLSGVPIIPKVLNLARVKYIKGEITEEMVSELQKKNIEKKSKELVLIPSKRK